MLTIANWWFRVVPAIVVLVVFFVMSCRGATPDDVAGWGPARWGMTEAQLAAAFGGSFRRLGGRLDFGGAYATHGVDDVKVAGTAFRAVFQMNAATGRLQQVVLQPVRRPGREAAFRTGLAALEEIYGRPAGTCTTPRAGGGPLSVEAWWRFPTTTVHAVFFDFFTRGMAFRDPNVDPDPLTPSYRTRRNVQRFLPRRAVIRFHATARRDLMSAGCPPDGSGR